MKYSVKSFKNFILEKTNGGGDQGGGDGGALPPDQHGPPAPRQKPTQWPWGDGAHDEHVRDHFYWQMDQENQQAEEDRIDDWSEWHDGLRGQWPPKPGYPPMPTWPDGGLPPHWREVPRFQDWWQKEQDALDDWRNPPEDEEPEGGWVA